MALSHLDSMPPELKLLTYYELDHMDLLALSHVSKFWRVVTLQDRRWKIWFELLVNPESGGKLRDFLTRFKPLDAFSARTIVTLCFSTNCSLCSKETPNIFLPLLKRICDDCLHPETHAVMSLSAALIAYDLSQKDIGDVIVIEDRYATHPKLVSALAVKNIAIQKYGGEDKLGVHLKRKKARLLEAYETRLAEYEIANSERKRLIASGNVAGAAAVTLKNNKKIPKTRPRMPPILKEAFTPLHYQTLTIMPTNYLTVETGCILAQGLLKCTLCIIIAELRAEEDGSPAQYPDFMRPALLPDHEHQKHYARRHDSCARRFRLMIGPSSCAPCLNRMAIDIKAESDSKAS
ncbi:hypothetical protein C8R44DRAFT_991415 [Mycena epipterygia]|nr:hypothetical protein C8R44DRAFT_991415 [Mycena epipterygia]